MLPYFRLAEVGYLGQLAYALVGAAVLLVDFGLLYTGSGLLGLVAQVAGFCIAFAWWQLGKSPRNSTFIYAGVLGMVVSSLSAVVSLSSAFVSVSSGFSPALASLTALSGVAGVVLLVTVYFQTRAFFSAARTLQKELFRWAGLAYIGGYLAALSVSAVGLSFQFSYDFTIIFSGGQVPVCTLSSAGDYCSLYFRVIFAQYAAGYVYSGFVAAISGVAFHRARMMLRIGPGANKGEFPVSQIS